VIMTTVISGSIVDQLQQGQDVDSEACTPQIRPELGSERPSNIMTLMNIKPRIRKASALHGSPYLNPLPSQRAAKRAYKRDTIIKRACRNVITKHEKQLVATCTAGRNEVLICEHKHVVLFFFFLM